MQVGRVEGLPPSQEEILAQQIEEKLERWEKQDRELEDKLNRAKKQRIVCALVGGTVAACISFLVSKILQQMSDN